MIRSQSCSRAGVWASQERERKFGLAAESREATRGQADCHQLARPRRVTGMQCCFASEEGLWKITNTSIRRRGKTAIAFLPRRHKS
jgi:hypothetical protein